MNMKKIRHEQNCHALSKVALTLIVLALPVAAHCDDRRPPPPGAMSDGKYLRTEFTKSGVEVCSSADYANVLYKELKAGAKRTQFCQCTYENFYAKFSDDELVREIGSMERNLDRLAEGKLSDSEKKEIRRNAEKNEQRLAESEKFCMNKLKVTVTPAPRG